MYLIVGIYHTSIIELWSWFVENPTHDIIRAGLDTREPYVEPIVELNIEPNVELDIKLAIDSCNRIDS